MKIEKSPASLLTRSDEKCFSMSRLPTFHLFNRHFELEVQALIVNSYWRRTIFAENSAILAQYRSHKPIS